jgi:septal ring factor EnvC (AmiA/AmiB activator)
MPFRLNSPSLIGLIVLCYGFFAGNPVQAQSNNPKSSPSRAGMEKERQELVRRIDQTRQQLEEVRRKRKSGLQQLQLLKNQIQNREKIIRNYNAEIVRQEVQITEVENVVQSLQVDLKQLRERYAQLLRQYQRQIMAPSMPLLILSASDVNQALRRTWHLRQYNQFRREQAAAIVDLQQELNQKGEVLQAEKERKEELKAKEEENKNALKQESQEQDKVVKALQKDEKKLRQELRNQEIARNRLQKNIEDLIRKEIEAARQAAAKTEDKGKANQGPTQQPQRNQALLELTPEAKALGKAFEENRGRLPWPLQKAMVSETFGFHPHPHLKNISIRNDGITLKAEAGAPVRACFRGEVTAVVNIPGMQKTVIIRHGQYLTVYAHLDQTQVSKGQKIQTGQTIGRLHVRQEDGQSYLQFQLWKGTAKVNPLPWLAGR